MIECKKLETLKEIEDNYNFFFIDLWGVVHNGVELFESVRSFLMRLKEKKKNNNFYHKCSKKSLCHISTVTTIWFVKK